MAAVPLLEKLEKLAPGYPRGREVLAMARKMARGARAGYGVALAPTTAGWPGQVLVLCIRRTRRFEI